jgi:hypothetical protein
MPKRQRIKRLVISLAAAAAAALAPAAGTAAAYDWTSNGTPGWVDAHTVAVAAAQPSDIFVQPYTTGAIGYDSLWLYPSPASSQRQYVTVSSKVWECGVTTLSETQLASYCASDGPRNTAWYVNPGGWQSVNDRTGLNISFVTTGSRYYTGQLTVNWYTAAGAWLGRKVLDYRGPSDGRCASGRCYWTGGGSSNWGYSFP